MSSDYCENTFINEANYTPWSESTENSDDNTRSSSTQSWVDETESSSTKELQELYDTFEAALYDEQSVSDLPKYLQDEVKIWSEHSLHIRIRGKKAILNERPNDFEEDQFNSDYEEILATHGTLEENLERTLTFSDDVKEVIENYPSEEQQVIKDDLRNAIVDRLFDQAWPKVLEKFEPVIKSMSARRKKAAESFNTAESYLENVRNQINPNSAARSNSSRSYLREMLNRKPFVDSRTEYQGILSSRGLRAHPKSSQTHPQKNVCILTNQRSAPKILSKRTSSTAAQKSNSQISASAARPEKTKPPALKKAEQPVILPPIEVLSIMPQDPNSKPFSAWRRFSKTLPRVTTNAPNYKKRIDNPKQQINQQKKRNSTALLKNESEFPTDNGIQIIGTQSATLSRSTRMHH